MDYRRALTNEHSKGIWDKIIQDVGSDKKKFEKIMNLFFSDDYRLVQRVSQVVGIIGEKQPQLIKPYLLKMVEMLSANSIDAIKRNVLRIFQFAKIPEEIEGELFDAALTFLKSGEEAIAIRVFSMTSLRRICEIYPELSTEIISTIELVLEENKSGGIQSRGKKEIKKLKAIKI